MPTGPPGTVEPRHLEKGMTIGVVAPSSGLRDPRLAAGIANIEARGYKVVTGDHLYDQHGYLAGMDVARGRDLTSMFARSEVDAVFCARGGYGACRMLDHVDWAVVAANPKLFVGYSDITSLHLAMERRVGLATIHGPMVTTLGGDLSDGARECFWSVIENACPYGRYATAEAAVRTLVGGAAEGRLAGGNLSLFAAAIMTDETPDFRDRIVLIEDVGDPVYRIDRLMVQLRRCGLLEQAAGFVVGTATGWEKFETGQAPIDLDRMWRDLLAPVGMPTIVGFPFGHEANPLTLPLGCMARLDATACTLEILEAAVT